MNPLFDVDRLETRLPQWSWGGKSGPAARLLLHDSFKTTPKMEKMGKPSAFYTDWGSGDYQCQGTVFKLPSAVIRRFSIEDMQALNFRNACIRLISAQAGSVYHEAQWQSSILMKSRTGPAVIIEWAILRPRWQAVANRGNRALHMRGQEGRRSRRNPYEPCS